MKPIKVNFTDFWPGFDKHNGNFFLELLSEKYQVEITEEDPDFLIYSNYGAEYLKYDCTRIFFSAENQRPDFSGCDYAITFDHINDKKHYRFPLCVLYYIGYIQYNKFKPLSPPLTKEEASEIWNKKKKFCCIVVSNPHAKKRIRFFESLNKVKRVDSGGRAFNNIGGPIGKSFEDKIEFLKQYKFVIAFENSSFNGYTTEKILEPLLTNCIPIYWGNPSIEKDFNKGRFINYDDFPSEKALIKRILEIEANPDLAIDILTKPVFPQAEFSIENERANLLKFLDSIILNEQTKPVSKKSGKKIIHFINRKYKGLVARVNYHLGMNFR